MFKGLSSMVKKSSFFAAFLLVFGVLFSSYAYAVDVSIDNVRVNGNTLAESRTNFLEDTDEMDVVVSLTAIKDLSNIRVEAILVDSSTGNTVADSTGTFILKTNQSTLVVLNLQLIDSMKRQDDFRLEVKVVDINDNEEKKFFGIRFTDGIKGAALDVSIDRVRVNNQIVATSKTNFIEESDEFDVLVEFTAVQDLEDAHIEAILRDLSSSKVVADASPNFDLEDGTSSSRLLRLELLDELKQSDSFELTIKFVDAEGNSVQQTYGLSMTDGNGVAGAAAGFRDLDISIDKVEVESDVVAENENNFVVIGEGKNELDVRVRLTSLEDVEDAHIDAVLFFENGDVVADATTTFDIGEDQNAVKELELPLVGEFEQNSFKLRVKIVDAEGDSEEKTYGLKISQQEFPFVISSIALEPENSAEAGKSLLVKLNVKNSGVVPLEGINAKVSIPELGVSSTKFIDQLKNSGRLSEISEEFVLKISDNVPTGTYAVRAEISSQFDGESEVKELPVFVLGKDEQSVQLVNDKLVVNVPIVKQDIYNDGREVIYQMTLTNEGPDANTYTLLLDGANWADLRLSESNTFIIRPKEPKTINIYTSTKISTRGEHEFLATIKSSDKILAQIPLKGNVVDVAKGILTANLKEALAIILIGAVVVFFVLALFFGLKKYLGEDSQELSKETTELDQESYYY